MNRTKISDGAPEWFNVVDKGKIDRYNEAMKKEDTMMIFSRYQKWITVTPRGKNRKYPLEKLKVLDMDKTSRIMPNWMQIKNPPLNPSNRVEMKSIIYNPIREVYL